MKRIQWLVDRYAAATEPEKPQLLLCGTPVCELDRETLIAAVHQAYEQAAKDRLMHRNYVRFERDLQVVIKRNQTCQR